MRNFDDRGNGKGQWISHARTLEKVGQDGKIGWARVRIAPISIPNLIFFFFLFWRGASSIAVHDFSNFHIHSCFMFIFHWCGLVYHIELHTGFCSFTF